MDVRTKREIVRRFKAGDSLGRLALDYQAGDFANVDELGKVLRDFINGKFSLVPLKRKARVG